MQKSRDRTFGRTSILYDRLERLLCPRVHFKMLVFDGEEVYIGSANLTGAGIGMKTDNKRNFEAGIPILLFIKHAARTRTRKQCI